MKCQTCRTKDVELLTRWERIRNWFFEHVNHTFFADDFDDLKQQKYTQGFSDGFERGVDSERNRIEKEQLRYAVEPHKPSGDELDQRLNDLLSNADLTKIVTFNDQTKKFYIGGKEVEHGRLQNLKQEAEAYEQFDLYQLLQETPKELAQRAMFIEGDAPKEQLAKGRTILYTLSTQKKIIEKFKNYNG